MFGIQVYSGTVRVRWDDFMERSPDIAGYAIAADTDVLTSGGHNLYTPSGAQCQVVYGGVDARGRNLGLTATINRTSHSRTGFAGEGATGNYPYLTGSPSGIHRGHLLARCLNGRGDRINWVPLKSDVNWAEWQRVESDVFDHINTARLRWAQITIQLEYDKAIPVPTRIGYRYLLYTGTNLISTTDRILNNRLDWDEISYTLQHNWV